MRAGSKGRGWLCAGSVALLAACADAGPSDPGVAGQGGTGGTPGVEPLALFTDEASARGLGLDEQYLYWASGAGLRRGPLVGGDAETLVALDDLLDVIVVGDQLFLHRGTPFVQTQIGRMSKDAREPTWLSTGSQPHGMVASDSGVFWSERGAEWNEGSLWRAALDGSGVLQIATGLVGPQQLAVHGSQLYFTHGNVTGCSPTEGLPCVETGLYRVPIAGGEVELVLATSAASNPVWDDDRMYWLAGYPRAGELMLLPPNGTGQPILDVVMDGPGGDTALTSDGEALYWAAESRVLRVPFEAAQVQRLITGLDGSVDIAVSGEWLYVADWAGRRILRVPTDGSAYRPTAAPITGPCPQPIGTAEELALTPRADRNLELLALYELEPDSLVVSQPTYDRVVSDVAAIRAVEPSLVEVSHRPASDGQTMQLEWSSDAAAAFDDGQYTAWSCLNDAYGLKDYRTLTSGIQLTLEGTYHIERVFELYRQLPGVTGGTPYLGVSDGPTICVTRSGETYDYVFDDTGGNCPVCEQHVAYHFQSAGAGQVTQVARWDSTLDPMVPAWFTDICEFRPRVGF